MTFIIWYTRVPVYPSLGWWKNDPKWLNIRSIIGLSLCYQLPGWILKWIYLGPNATMPVTNHIFKPPILDHLNLHGPLFVGEGPWGEYEAHLQKSHIVNSYLWLQGFKGFHPQNSYRAMPETTMTSCVNVDTGYSITGCQDHRPPTKASTLLSIVIANNVVNQMSQTRFCAHDFSRPKLQNWASKGWTNIAIEKNHL